MGRDARFSPLRAPRAWSVASLLGAAFLMTPLVAFASEYPLGQILPGDAATKFEGVGIKSSTDLLKQGARASDRKKVAKKVGISPKQITQWVWMCDMLRVKGIGPIMARLLDAAKVSSVAKLKRQRAPQLYKKLLATNQRTKITDNPPSQQHLANWIGQAKKLPIVAR